MDRRIFSYFAIAAKFATKKRNGRAFYLGAIGVRADGALVISTNHASHTLCASGHAEARLARKLDFGASEVYVVRLRKLDDEFGMARPCLDCQRVLRAKGVKKCYFSISPREFGMMDLTKGIDRYYPIRNISGS